MKSKRILSSVLAALMIVVPIEVNAEEIRHTNYKFTDMDNIVVSVPDTIYLSYDSLDKSFKGQNQIIVSGGEGYSVEVAVDSTNIKYANEDDRSITANGTISFGTEGVEAWSEEEISASIGKDIAVVVSEFPQNTIGTYRSNINYNINISENIKLEDDKYFTKTVNTKDMTCEITGFTNYGIEWMMSETEDKGAKELIIPETLVVNGKKYTVTSIYRDSFNTAGRFLNNYGTENEKEEKFSTIKDYGIKKLVIPNTVKSIGNGAFKSNQIEEVSLADGLESIGDYAFQYCDKLKSVEIPNSVTYTGKYAFYDCRSLETVTLSQGMKVIEENCFYNCALKSIEIPSTITKIDIGAFSNCKLLESVDIPDCVTSIEGNAFRGCKSLTEMTLPDSIVIINTWVFADCTSLASVRLSKNITSIGTGAFSNCTSLTTIEIPSKVTTIGSNAFQGSGLTEIIIPDNVTSIGGGTFSKCKSLAHVVLSNNIDKIENQTFQDCLMLLEITIPSKVTTIGSNVFQGSGLTEISLPNTVLKINSAAFYIVNNLETVYYRGTQEERNNNLTIDNNREYNQTLLDANWIYLDARTTIVSDDGYFTLATDSNASSCDITGLTDEGKEWMETETFTIATNSNAVATNSNATVSGGDAEPEFIEKAGVLIIPETLYVEKEEYEVTNIKSDAFTNNDNLAVVLIPNMELSIEEHAFGNDIAISDVYYEGTREEKDTNLHIAENNDSLINASWHCTDDEEDIIEEDIITNEYKVIFLDEDGSTELKVLDIEENNIIEASDIPEHTKEETELATFEFIGWFIQNEDNSITDTKFDFETPITQNIVLVAQFKETLKELEENQEDSTEIEDKGELEDDITTEDGEVDNIEEETGEIEQTEEEPEGTIEETEEETEGTIEETEEIEKEPEEVEQETEEESEETEQEIEEDTSENDSTNILEENTYEIEEDAVPIEDEESDTVSGNDMVMYKEENKEEREEE